MAPPPAAVAAPLLCEPCAENGNAALAASQAGGGGGSFEVLVRQTGQLVADDSRFDLIGIVREGGTSDDADEDFGSAGLSSDPTGGGGTGGDPTGERGGKRARLSALPPSHSGVAVVHFQLVGAALYGLTRRQLESEHAVDLNQLNETFAQRLNGWVADGRRPKPFVASGPVRSRALRAASPGARGVVEGEEKSLFTIRFVVGGRCALADVWPVVVEIADEVIAAEYARLNLCRCDLG